MEAIRLQKVVEKDGEIFVTGLPCKKGEHVEVILLTEPSDDVPKRPTLTTHRLLQSGLIGLWKDRKDIEYSAVNARQLREQAQRR